MRCAIFTLQGLNYGNRLQNYALQVVLGRCGHRAYSLRRNNVPLRSLKEFGRSLLKDDYVNAFRRFDRNIRFASDVVSGDYTTSRLANKYDCFVMGSDQIWNPDFGDNTEVGYLPMVPREKKIAYAASYGVSGIRDTTGGIARGLRSVAAISMREDAGADIVRGLADIDAPVVLDPTMLLTADDWSAVSKKPLALADVHAYAFKYVLGDDANGDTIEEMASDLGLKIIDAMDRSLKLGPAEFVWLIAHSSFVCTDSFHASVFALLHHKPLAIFERCGKERDMSSRFDTLCGSFGLHGMRSSEADFALDAAMGIDWSAFERELIRRRGESVAWLNGALAACASLRDGRP